MGGRMPESDGKRTRDLVSTARAHERARWALRQTRSHVLAPHFNVSASRVRHFAADDLSGPLTAVCAAVADPKCDGEAFQVAIEESMEDRYLDVDRGTLEGRYGHLRLEAEHHCQAQQDRALMADGPGTNDALRKHARVLLEMAAIRRRLGLEDS